MDVAAAFKATRARVKAGHASTTGADNAFLQKQPSFGAGAMARAPTTLSAPDSLLSASAPVLVANSTAVEPESAYEVANKRKRGTVSVSVPPKAKRGRAGARAQSPQELLKIGDDRSGDESHEISNSKKAAASAQASQAMKIAAVTCVDAEAKTATPNLDWLAFMTSPHPAAASIFASAADRDTILAMRAISKAWCNAVTAFPWALERWDSHRIVNQAMPADALPRWRTLFPHATGATVMMPIPDKLVHHLNGVQRLHLYWSMRDDPYDAPVLWKCAVEVVSPHEPP
jgi:hypothetical protein